MSDQWYTATSGSGSFHLTIAYKPARHETLTIDAFDLLKVIGKGSFGKVMQVRKKDTQRIYALKTIRKANIASRPGEITHILAERTVLALVNNPFIVPLKFSFQNPDKLYLVMSFGVLCWDIKVIRVLFDLFPSKRGGVVLSSAA
jgi:serum/glucocorticoid-regulated kinase 2